ncbi:hypothetical protein MTO96_015290 [Rhipicephalus appendiculatus]
MLSRARLSAVLIPSPLLTYPESSSESSDSDDDLNRVCEEEFAQLFDIPKRIPKASGYVVNVVRMYSDKEFRRNFQLPRVSCYALIERFSKPSFYPSNQRHGGSPAKTAEEHILSFLWKDNKTLLSISFLKRKSSTKQANWFRHSEKQLCDALAN